MQGEGSNRTVVCPACGSGNLRPSKRLSMRCDACRGVLAGPMLRTLLDVVSLPEVGASSTSDRASLTEEGRRSAWLDFYQTQYRKLLDTDQEDETDSLPDA